MTFVKRTATVLFVCLAIVLLPLTATAQNGSPLSDSPLANKSLDNSVSLSSEAEFLEYDQAYILTLEIANQATANQVTPNIVLNWDIEPGYYLYHKEFRINAYVDGQAVPVEYQIPKGKIKYDENFSEDREVFYDNVSIPVTAEDVAANQILQLSVRAQGCADAGLCYVPNTKYFEVDFGNGTTTPTGNFLAKQGTTVGDSSANSTAAAAVIDAEPVSVTYLLYMMLLALAGGLILNLMPCVFPVLSIKALSFVSARGSDHSHHVHGWVYTAGAVSSFLAMGGIIVGIRAAGGNADWGMQLQSPVFVAMMVYLFLIMGLSLSGFVHFGSSLMGIGQSLTTRQGLQGSFFTGVLAVVVASPCTAPAMATALGVALTQSAPVALTIFACLGFGLALPFLILSYSPKLASYLPKPGAWMETLKQILAFPLYLTAAGGLWVLGRQTSSDTLTVVILGGIAIVFAIWLWQKRPRSTFGKYSQIALCLVAVIGGIALGVQAPNYGKGDYWQDYSPELVAQLRAEGRPLFINLTAAWCITCHANERIALSRDEVKEAAEKYNIAMIKGDYTNEDPRITELLHEYRRVGVPTYLMFSTDSSKPAEILPQVLTIDTVVEAMERAAANQKAVAQN